MSARTSSRRARAIARGYTFIEVMMGLSLLAIFSVGVFSLQKIATFGNLRARDLAMGTHLAQTWMDRLRVDAASWTMPSPSYPGVPTNIGATKWINVVQTSPNVWFRPAEVVNVGGPGFDPLGNDVPLALANTAAYCTHVRLNWAYPPAPAGQTTAGSMNVIRAEVRVFWAREGAIYPPFGASVCDPSQSTAAFDTPSMNPLQRYHFVYLASSLTENTAQ